MHRPVRRQDWNDDLAIDIRRLERFCRVLVYGDETGDDQSVKDVFFTGILP
jgi:hypothetical protein